MDHIYHIYVQDKCVLHNLSEEKFKESWNILNTLVGFMKTDYTTSDLSYEELESYQGSELSLSESSY